MTDAIIDISDLLLSWGRSRAMSDAHHLDYPHQSPYAREMRNSGQWATKVPALDDDLHGQVDQAVSELKLRGGERHEVIVLAYIYGMNDQTIAYHKRCSRSKVREARIAGENWLDARLI